MHLVRMFVGTLKKIVVVEPEKFVILKGFSFIN